MKKTATVKRILQWVKPYRKYLLLSIISALLVTAAQLLIPILCGEAIDGMLGAGQVDMALIARYMGAVALTAAVGAAAQQVLAWCNNRVTYGTCRDLRNAISEKFHTLPLSYLDKHPTGDLVSRMIADVDTLGEGLLMGFTQLFTGMITILGTLIIMLTLNVTVTLVVVLLTPMSFFVAGFIARRTHRYFQEQTQVRGEQTALINELVEGQRIVRSFGYEDRSLAQFDAVNTRLEKAALNATFFSSLTNPSTRLVNNIVYAFVGLASALFAIGGGISVGGISVFLSYASQYAKPFNEISGVVTELQNALSCAGRIFALLDEPDQSPEPEQPAQVPCTGAVQLKNVRFSYEPEQRLIENLNLDVKPGQRVAIVGPTGCGKTTLINLLMRFYDVSGGSICLDDVDIRNMERKALRSQYGMVLQDTWLKKGTIRQNIAYGCLDAAEEEIVAAAKAAHAHSFIRRLPQGYDTPIGENGSGLSAGQRQLLCIARAMLRLPPMLILDEATSSIDTRTEQKIQAAFAQMMQGRTSFVVAHRLSTIREADVILVMKDGHVIEQGDHNTLLAQKGFYYQLYNSQFAGQ